MPLCSIPGGTNSPRARTTTVNRAQAAVSAYDSRYISPLTSPPRTEITWPSGTTRRGPACGPLDPGASAAVLLGDQAVGRMKGNDGRERSSMPRGRSAAGDRISDRRSGPCWPGRTGPAGAEGQCEVVQDLLG